MKPTKTLSAIIFLALLTAGCMDAEKALEGNLIEKESLINNSQFIDESKQRADKVVEYGPDVADIDHSNIRKETNTLLNTEEVPNYEDLKDDGVGKIFPVDVNVENVDIRTFMQMLSRITNVNFLVSDEVSGTVTAQLEDVSWPNALDSVLSLKGLAKHVDNKANIIRIHDQGTLVSIENFERQRKQDLQKTAELARESEPLYTEAYKLFYTKPKDVKTILQGILGITDAVGTAGAGAGAGGAQRITTAQITVDERVNQIIVKARRNDLDIIEKVIQKVDSRTKQVFIEAFVVEVNDDFEKRLGTTLGVDLEDDGYNNGIRSNTLNVRGNGLIGTPSSGVTSTGNTNSVSDFAVAGATSGIGGAIGLANLADLKLAITALERDQVSKVISNPRIFTLDNQEATIFQGTEVPYETVSADGTSIQFKSAGLNLSVTPKVVGDGNLMMSVSLNKDTVDTSQANPPITSSAIKTNLVTKDGSIVVIGGIYTQDKTDTEDKVPFFGDLPYAGKLFRRDGRSNARKELMIFLAPRII